MVVALAGCNGARVGVEVTNPIPQVKGGTPADELVNDGDDATPWMRKGTEREDVFATDGSLPDPACKVQIKGLNINGGVHCIKKAGTATVFEERNHERTCGFITCRHLCGTSFRDRVCCTLTCRCQRNAYHSE